MRRFSHRLCISCAAPEGAQEMLVDPAPGTYFRPPYVGHRGLDVDGAAELAGVVTGLLLDANGDDARSL